MADLLNDDHGLVRQMAEGKEEAFNMLYARYQGPLYRFSWHMSSNAATAEEITQEVFLLLIRNPAAYDPAKGSLGGYLFGIARNLTRRVTRRDRLDEPISDFAETDECEGAWAVGTDLLLSLGQEESLDCLRKAVLALPEQFREVVVLCDLEELSYPQAAAVLGCACGTVASRLHRARTMLRSRLSVQGCAK